jgi:hypothetical protein
MDKTATAPSMTVVSAALSVAAGTGSSEVFDTTSSNAQRFAAVC